MAYPNLIAEMARIQITRHDIAKSRQRSANIVSNWLDGKTKIPLEDAFAIQEEFFPSLAVTYLYAKTPQYGNPAAEVVRDN